MVTGSIKKKDQAIADAILSGMTYEQAFDYVMPEKKDSWDRHAKVVNVGKIMAKPVVREYFESQKKAVEEEKARIAREEIVWSYRDSLDALKFVVKMAQRDALDIAKNNREGKQFQKTMAANTATSIVGAVNSLNKMLGYDGPINQAHETQETIASRIMALSPIHEDPDEFTDTPQGLKNGGGK